MSPRVKLSAAVSAVVLAVFGSAVAETKDPFPHHRFTAAPFEPNLGQAAPDIRFLARFPAYIVGLRERGFTVLAKSEFEGPLGVLPSRTEPAQPPLFDIGFAGSNPQQIEGIHRTTTMSNYLIGSDPAAWINSVPHFERVLYHDLYPGIDVVFYVAAQRLEYDFIVRPGASASTIELTFGSETKLQPDGSLVSSTGVGAFTLSAPRAYQMPDGKRRLVDSDYRVSDSGHIQLNMGRYDRTRTLVVDPVLSYSSRFGGEESDVFEAIAVDPEGNIYAAGRSHSVNFPTTAGALQTSNRSRAGWQDAVVVKIDPFTSSVVYSTYLGGDLADAAFGIEVDRDGRVYLGGMTCSADFPATASAYSQTISGDAQYCYADAFVSVIVPSGTGLEYSTYVGGPGDDRIGRMALASDGTVFIAGTTSGSFIRTIGTLQGSSQLGGDVFLARIDPVASGPSSLIYAATVGKAGEEALSGIAVDDCGNSFIAGRVIGQWPTTPGAFQPSSPDASKSHAFVAKINETGTSLVYSSYLGGNGDGMATGVAVGPDGGAIVVGHAQSSNFPTTAGSFQSTRQGSGDAFVTKFNAQGTGLVYSTYLGGGDPGSGGAEYALGVSTDSGGIAYVTGITVNSNFPTTENAFQRTHQGPAYAHDAFITELAQDGSSLVFSSLLGGIEDDGGQAVAQDGSGGAYLAGYTQSPDFPVTVGVPPISTDSWGDAFVAKTNPAGNVRPTDGIAPDTRMVSTPPKVTNSPNATFEFTSNEIRSTFECSLDGAPYGRCGCPKRYVALSDGTHTFRVRAVDFAGNTDPTQLEYSWTVDTDLPETLITAGPSGTTTSSSATFQLASDEAPVTYACSLDGQAFRPCSPVVTYGGLADGSHQFRARATDLAGNTDPTPAMRTWVVDAVGPVIQFLRPGPGIWMNDRLLVGGTVMPIVIGSVTVQATAADAQSGVSSFTFRVDGQAIPPATVSYDSEAGVWSFELTAAPGPHVVTAEATNGSGRSSSVALTTLVLPG